MKKLFALVVRAMRATILLPGPAMSEAIGTRWVWIFLIVSLFAPGVIGHLVLTDTFTIDPWPNGGQWATAFFLIGFAAIATGLWPWSGRFREMSVELLGALAITDTVWQLIWTHSVTGNWLVPAWMTLAAVAMLVRRAGARPLRWLAAPALAITVLGLPFGLINPHRAIIDESQDPVDHTEGRYWYSISEHDLYSQNDLLDEALVQLKPQRPGIADLYFVGMAAHGNQDVFKKEVLFARDLMAHRFDARDRTTLLVNNPDTVTQYPLASATSLRRTLAHLGGVMSEEDILFLFITSHGSPEIGVDVSAGHVSFDDIAPAQLRQMLDASAIKRRVLLVSACYSGSYIEPLADENTLIITAAAQDRTSFGCSNLADFTYFGQAYLRDALNETRSFTAAFDIARDAVTAREAQEGLDASQPQISVGTQAQQWIEQYAQSLGTDYRQLAIPATGVPIPAVVISPVHHELATLLWPASERTQAKRACLQTARRHSPQAQVQRAKHHWDGMQHDTELWQTLNTTYGQLARADCAIRHDGPRHHEALVAQIAQHMTPQQARQTLALLQAPQHQPLRALMRDRFGADRTQRVDQAFEHTRELQDRLTAVKQRLWERWQKRERDTAPAQLADIANTVDTATYVP